MSEADSLSVPAISSALRTNWLGRPVHYRAATGSTNDDLHELSLKGAPAGTLLVTDYQSQGKGRLDRRWETPPGTSLLCSLLFRPGWPAEQAAWLTMAAGVAAVEAIRSLTGLAAFLKWPNDLVLAGENGDWQKVGGLLASGTFANQELASLILGTGINVNIPAGALPQASTPPTSLLIALGRPVSRLALLAAYLTQLENLYQAAGEGHSPHSVWQERLVTLGQPVVISNLGRPSPLSGIAEGTDRWGSLLVRDRTGQLHTIAAGDATLRSTQEPEQQAGSRFDI